MDQNANRMYKSPSLEQGVVSTSSGDELSVIQRQTKNGYTPKWGTWEDDEVCSRETE